ncbi:MAG: FAD:protein FMN transferase [Rhodobacterales bacterium]|nr:FAD:protein FMN transferase [Rhodobacterales bacterium]
MRRFLMAFLVVLVAAVAVRAMPPSSRDNEYHETLYVFGTLVEIVIHGEEKAVAQRAAADIAREFNRIHRDWHAWRPGALDRLNAAIAAGRPFTASPELAALLRRARDLSKASGGLFEPAIGGLIAAWGFHQDTPPTGAPPSDATITRWTAARPRMTDLVFDGNTIRSRNRSVRIDLGGFAKGAALDLAAALLRRRGVTNAVLNAGGDLNVLGRHGARPWRVAIRDPFEWGAVAAVDMRPGEVLYTSGNYERYLEQDGVRFSHILDPRTGRPAPDIVSASVLDVDGALADAAATALCVAGRDGWRAVAAAMGVRAALLIDADGHILMTPEMHRRVTLVHPGEHPGAPVVASVANPTTATDKGVP